MKDEAAKTHAQEKNKEKEKDDPKVAKTDKVLIGNKASWAVAKAIGEVRRDGFLLYLPR
jgi:Xaa-Pro aminopeptidase